MKERLYRFAKTGPSRREGAAPSPCYRIKGATEAEAHVYLYDEISFWGVSAEEFVTDLQSVQSETIHLHLNTPGGLVFDGMAVYNALLSHPARVVTHIEGIAASMGSVIALAGNEVRIAKTAFVMIHDPWSIVIGSAEDLLKEAEVLEKIGGTMVGVYSAKTQKSRDQVREIMTAETWWDADEALASGFADSVFNDPDEEREEARAALARFDLSVFSKTPQSLLNLADRARGRGTGDLPSKRDVEKVLRGSGFSRAQAQAFIARGYGGVPRDSERPETVEAEDLSRLIDRIQKSTR